MDIRTTRLVIGGLAVGSLVFMVALGYSLKKPKELALLEAVLEAENRPVEIFASDPRIGGASPPVTIVAFMDFGCEHCKTSDAILKQVIKEYPNDVRWVWKDLPVTTDPEESRPAHIAARCSHEQGRFWEYHDALFANQETFPKDRAFFLQLARQVNLDARAFEGCLDQSEKVERLIDRSILMAQDVGVRAVPYLVVNNTSRIYGDFSLLNIQEEIKQWIPQK